MGLIWWPVAGPAAAGGGHCRGETVQAPGVAGRSTKGPEPAGLACQWRTELIVVLNLFDIIPGREKQYAEYLRRVQPILSRHGARILVYGLTRMVYFGNANQQYCGLIAYPNITAFKQFSGDPEFLEIRPLRDDSTCRYILTAIEDFETLNHAVEFLENGGRH
jgi:uncharacterized protein (DUF1330 family)